jgi:hypothetical protein
MSAVAEQRQREAGDGPEYRKFPAPALVREQPAVAAVSEIGSEQQMDTEKDRDCARIDAENRA